MTYTILEDEPYVVCASYPVPDTAWLVHLWQGTVGLRTSPRRKLSSGSLVKVTTGEVYTSVTSVVQPYGHQQIFTFLTWGLRQEMEKCWTPQHCSKAASHGERKAMSHFHGERGDKETIKGSCALQYSSSTDPASHTSPKQSLSGHSFARLQLHAVKEGLKDDWVSHFQGTKASPDACCRQSSGGTYLKQTLGRLPRSQRF